MATKHYYPGVALIGQRAMGITRASDPRPVLATQNLNMCVALHGYDRQSKVGFLCHIDFCFTVGNLKKLAEELTNHVRPGTRFSCTITGGKPWTHARSPSIRGRIRKELQFLNSQGRIQFDIEHETPMPDRWSRDVFLHKPFAYCLDTRSGNVRPFPNGKPSLPLKNLLSRLRFDYVFDQKG